MTARRVMKCLPLLAAWPLLQGGCISNAIEFELLNLVSGQVFFGMQTVLNNLIDFNF